MRELTLDEVRDLLARPEELVAVWPDAAGERLDAIVPRHLERLGFRFVAEWDGDGSLAGIAYGYRGSAGEWWHDLVSRAMDDTARSRWLRAGHFEFVELAVRADLRRRGIGSRLHDALLTGLDAPTAVLSTEVDKCPGDRAVPRPRLGGRRPGDRLRRRLPAVSRDGKRPAGLSVAPPREGTL